MKHEIVSRLLRATDALRAGDPAGATAVIRAALAAGGLIPHEPERTAAPPRSAEPRVESPPAAPPRWKAPLGEVIRTLKEGRRSLGNGAAGRPLPKAPVDLPLPDNAEFRDHVFACAAGRRRYRLYVPASAQDGLEGLVVMLHGCTQTPEDFAAGTGMNALAEEYRLLVAYPAQTSSDNAMSCWNWFRPSDQGRDAGEPAILAGLAAQLRDEFAIAHDRVFVAGLSAGGAMAAIMGETHPDLFAGVGIHSGLANGAATDVASAFAAMRGNGAPGAVAARRRGEARPRLIVFHGSTDATVHPSNVEHILERHGAVGPVHRTVQPATGGARGYARTVVDGKDGSAACESWIVEGAPHGWSGGSAQGSYTDPLGPDASRAMVRFFLRGSSDG